MSVLEEFFEQEGLGAIVRAVELGVALELPRGAERPATLVQTEAGVYLAAAMARTLGRAIDLTEVSSLRYDAGWLGDSLVVDAVPYAVPARQGAEVKELLAVGRLFASAPEPVDAGHFDSDSRYIEVTGAIDRTWLRTRLQTGESVVAWLETATSEETGSAILPGAKGWWRYLLTDRRALRVAISEVGDVLVRDVPGVLSVDRNLGRNTVDGGGATWMSTLKNDGKFIEIAGLPALTPIERIRAAARLNYSRRSGSAAQVQASAKAMARLAEMGVSDPFDDALLAMARGEADGVVDALARAKPERGDDLLTWWRDLALDDAEGRRLVTALLSREESPQRLAQLTVPLHEALHAAMHPSEDAVQAAHDIELAEHLLIAGLSEAAARLLTTTLGELPDQELDDILPPEQADLTAGEGGQFLRVRVLELLVACRPADEPDVDALRELAVLQPLVPRHLDDLLSVAEPPLSHRVAVARELLHPGGLAVPPAVDRPAPARGLDEQALVRVKHPLARAEGLFSWLQARIAKLQVPDHGALRAYAQRADSGPILEALTDAALALGVATPEAYLSHGEKSHGIHSYEEPEPFVLIGASHLEPGNPYQLTPTELDFAVASELAHLRFGHSRVTSAEVWDGTWDAGMQAFNVFGTVLTFGSANVVASMLGRREAFATISKMVTSDTMKRAVTVSEQVQSAASYAEKGRTLLEQAQIAERETQIGKGHEEVLAAHRVMQLTADRAGLLVCGDLVSAVRAVFLTERSSRDELALAERHGLVTALGRRDPDGRPFLQPLAIRVAALVSFWLSRDYLELRQQLAAAKS